MGSSQSREDFIDGMFNTYQLDPKTGKLILHQLLHYQKYVRHDYYFEFNHLASLFFLDKKKDGAFYKSDLLEFAKIFVQFKIKNEYDYLRKFQAYASTLFWKELQDVNGQRNVCEWMITLLKESRGIRTFPNNTEKFFSSQAINDLFVVLRVQDYNGLSFDDFIQDYGQIELANADYDDVVPISVVEDFFMDFLDECYTFLQNILTTTSTII
ncbi:EF-hand domain-containing protein [Entamoeba marina]